ncbi:MAG TPA: oxygen-independent coproporphyrinogen III oxidase [Steroidobacteraceae bacterium]|nr:oxygen-independent coproporphyrinogen III oxidase [Steroidobacteraceae bacterium]
MDTSLPSIQFDPELISRYDINGPRYTSYPTAVQFHPNFAAEHYRNAATKSNTEGGPLSIYIHVPFCTSPCFYCGCSRIITRDHLKADAYLQHLYKEIELQSSLFDRLRQVRQLHFGGGTPTFLDTEQFQSLMNKLQKHFTMVCDGSHEYSIEIDPRTLTPDMIPQLAAMGFNRVSLGVQDFDHDVQVAVNRVQSVEQTLNAIVTAHEYGFKSVNVDLIYGLPKQTPEKFAKTLELIVDAQPERVALYGYAHMPHLFKAQRRIHDADLPDPATRLALLQLSVNTLTNAGYVYIGMDHFARSDDELVQAQRNGTLHRNFQGYSTRADCDLIALGVSSISKVGNVYSQNTKSLIEYYASLDQSSLPIQRGVVLDRDDEIRRTVIQGIMCQGYLDFKRLSAELHIDFNWYFLHEILDLRALQRDGLIELDDDSLRVTSKGRLLLRHVAMVFDAYLKHASRQQFSKAV